MTKHNRGGPNIIEAENNINGSPLFFLIIMDVLIKKFRTMCNTASDINEHLPVLFRYAKQCNSALELGVRGCVSSWAISAGLLENKNGIKKKIFMNDSRECQIGELIDVLEPLSIDVKYEWKNDLEIEFGPDEKYDMVFIDTWHVYGQIKRELEKFSSIATKFIIMHDTTVDEVDGETLREYGYNYQQAFIRATELATETGIPRDEILKGMWYGIEEFLANHPEWYIKQRFFNNNGLMVLARR